MNNKNEFVPEWAMGIIWYQIFPERFRNGDKTNDPKLADQLNSWPHNQAAPYQIHPWESDWYTRQPYELGNGMNLSDTLQRRRYGGDLQGIMDKLDYLENLGVQALYLNPVFEAPSSHKYDASTWHHVDPTFGPDPEGDRAMIAAENPLDSKTWKWTSADKLLLALIDELHKRNMYIILDGVFNHMGLNSWVYRDIIKNQRDSVCKDWLKVTKWADETEDGSTKIKTWEGYKELPEIRQDKNGIVDGPAAYIHEITKRWMDPLGNGDLSKGVDGWRLDVAFCIKHPFWKKWRKQVREINPQAYLLAEVIDTPEAQIPYLEGDEFDAVMNYNFAFALSEYFIRIDDPMSPSELDEKLTHLRTVYPAEVTHVMHNLLDSHDTDRVASRIMNADLFNMRNWGEYYEKSKAVNPKYNTEKPDMLARRTQKLMIAFQMTYPGAPVIYYGDEAGLWGANDPCNRKPMLWPNLSFDDEVVFPNDKNNEQNQIGNAEKQKPNEKNGQSYANGNSDKPLSDRNGKRHFVEFDASLFEFYRTLVHLRRNSPALMKGAYKTVITDDECELFGFKRYIGNEIIVVLFNTGYEEQRVTINNYIIKSVLFEMDAEKQSANSIIIEPNSVAILLCTNG